MVSAGVRCKEVGEGYACAKHGEMGDERSCKVVCLVGSLFRGSGIKSSSGSLRLFAGLFL